MTLSEGSAYESVVHALQSHNVELVESVIKVTKLVAPHLSYGMRKDLERVIAEELFHDRCPPAYRGDWASLNVYLGQLP